MDNAQERNLDKVQQEYNLNCLRLGDVVYKVSALEAEIERLEREAGKLRGTLKSLNQEAAAKAAVATEAPSEQK